MQIVRKRCKRNKKKRQACFLLSVVLLLGPLIHLHAAPATFITALPVSQDQLLARFSFNPTLSSNPSAPSGGTQLNNYQFPETFLYGLTDKIALALDARQGFSSMQEGLPQGSQNLSASGFGDTLVFARYTLFDIDRPGSTFRIAPLLGAYLPTGYYDKSNASGLLPQALQNGSGSVDPFMGLTAAFYNRNYGWSWDATWRHNLPSPGGFDLGDEARTDGEFEFRIFPHSLPSSFLPNELWGVFETNLISNNRSEIAGNLDSASGGFSWLFWSGFDYATLHWELGAEVGVPVVQNLNGPGQVKQIVSFRLFYEYYLAMPSWRKKKPHFNQPGL